MLNLFRRERNFYGLDIGSSRVKASCVNVRNSENMEILGAQDTPTNGFKKSSISDLGDLAECIQTTLSALSQKTGTKIKDLQLGIGAQLIEHRRSQAIIPLVEQGSKIITPNDVKLVNEQARLLGMKMDEDTIHHFAQVYRIDEVNSALNPVGLYARKLFVDLLLIVMNVTRINNLIKAVNQAGFEVDNIFFTSFAASEVCLNPKVKTDGCALIDIGSSATKVLIFKEGFLQNLDDIPLGGDHATRNIAQNLRLSFDLAEEIKKSYGMALSGEQEDPKSFSGEEAQESNQESLTLQKNSLTLTKERKNRVVDEEILVKNDAGYLPVKREMICHSLEPEINKLVSAIDKSLRGPFYHELKSGIIIVGGGSLLPGLLERIEKITNLPVRMGKVIAGGIQLNSPAIFSASVGLTQLGFAKRFALPFRPQGGGWTKGFSNRLRELYQEYF